MSIASERAVRDLLHLTFGVDAAGMDAFTDAGMAVSELVTLYDLVSATECTSALEIGMANATSSVVICAAMTGREQATLVSIDPYQATDYRNEGVANVARAGFAARHRLIEEPDYLALARLVRERERFDLVLIDGWHSFDYAMLDIFYSDLLLRDGGLLMLHDTDWPSVHKAVRFLETHKPYDRVSPAPMVALDALTSRLLRRLRTAFRGRTALEEAHARRTKWRSLSAYRKRRTEITPQHARPSF